MQQIFKFSISIYPDASNTSERGYPEMTSQNIGTAVLEQATWVSWL